MADTLHKRVKGEDAKCHILFKEKEKFYQKKNSIFISQIKYGQKRVNLQHYYFSFSFSRTKIKRILEKKRRKHNKFLIYHDSNNI